MKPAFRRAGRAALLYALAFTGGLGALPLAVTSGASFLGKDMTQLAAGVMGFYPGVAALEVAKVAMVIMATSFFMSIPFALAAERAGRWRRLVFPCMPLVAYALWWLGGVIKYPALYEALLPGWTGAIIVGLARLISPTVVFNLALATLAVPLALSWRKVALPRNAPVVSVAVASALALSIGIKPSTRVEAEAATPNVLLIAIDSLRSDRLERPDVTPNLRALLDDSSAVSFRDHYVGIPRTFPSWVEMLEGRYSARTGIRHMFPGFGPRTQERPGVATLLRSRGYRTAVVSDFAGDIFPRFEAGFMEVEAPKLTLKTMIRMGVGQMFPAFLPVLTTGPTRRLFPALKQSPAYADPAHLREDLSRQIVKGSGPWLVTGFFSTAHFPYAAPYPYYGMFADPDYSGPFKFQRNPDLSAGAEPESAEVAQVRALYDGSLRAIDDELGKLFGELKQAGLWDSTMIIVTADHGEDLFEPGRLQGHGEHLRGENVLKVPLILKLASGRKPKRHFVERTSRSIDVASTIAGAVGLSGRVGDGVNLLPWALGESGDDADLLAYAETGIWFSRGGAGFFQKKRLDYPGISGLLAFDQGYSGEIVLNPTYERVVVSGKHRMLIDGDYKLIYMPTPGGVEYELYNRRVDPENRFDLALADPARVQAMRDRLRDFVIAQESAETRIIDGFVVPP